jgi:arginyl-tRNA synthetase
MKQYIEEAITVALQTLKIPPSDFVVEHPTQLNHGDYTCNVALVAAKAVKMSPRMLAEKLARSLSESLSEIDHVEVLGPGFINFFLKRSYFTEQINTALKSNMEWGRNDTELGELVLIEYTSPNLFKPLHIGNLVGNIIGESLARLHTLAGAEVKRINYPSDIGLTVAKGVWGLSTTGNNPNDIDDIGNAYRIGNEAYESNDIAKLEIEDINKALYERSNETFNTLRDTGLATSRRHLAELCRLLGTTFDTEIPESTASVPGIEIVRKNIGTVFTESAGAVVFEGERAGLHTRVFINSKGLPTYEAKDLGNFTLKQAAYPHWTQSIIVTGNEQREYFKVLFSAIKELFPEVTNRRLEHIPTGFLTLTTGKMSSRKGNVLTGESLLAELNDAAREKAKETRTDDINTLAEAVAVGALKYQILRHSLGSDIVFDKEKSLSFEGDSGPYLQYTYARTVSVLKRGNSLGIIPNVNVVPANSYQIERKIYKFPEVIESALHDRSPHQIISYLTDLAGSFNAFYANEKIADVADIHAPYKLAITEATKQTLKNGLWALGIVAPEQM